MFTQIALKSSSCLKMVHELAEPSWCFTWCIHASLALKNLHNSMNVQLFNDPTSPLAEWGINVPKILEWSSWKCMNHAWNVPCIFPHKYDPWIFKHMNSQQLWYGVARGPRSSCQVTRNSYESSRRTDLKSKQRIRLKTNQIWKLRSPKQSRTAMNQRSYE